MLDETKKLFNDNILNEALSRFGASPETCQKLGGFEAYVFELTKPNGSFILKITHTNRRTPDYIMGELEFVNYLAYHGVPTSLAMPSENGSYVETIPDNNGGQFLAYCFEKADGRLTKREDWDEPFVRQWGEISAVMNRLAIEFQPSRDNYRRQQWFDDPIYDIKGAIPSDKPETYNNCKKILDNIKRLPQSSDTYGLIHGDLHQGNLFKDNTGILIPFDFDDAEYHYFASDIAIPLYYTAPSPLENNGKTRKEFGEFFLNEFLVGYTGERKIERYWLERIPDFLLLRTVIMMSIFYQVTFDDELDDKKGDYLAHFHKRIDDNVPVVDLAYKKIAARYGTL